MKKTRVFVALMTVGTFLLASCGDKKEEASGEAGDKKEEASKEEASNEGKEQEEASAEDKEKLAIEAFKKEITDLGILADLIAFEEEAEKAEENPVQFMEVLDAFVEKVGGVSAEGLPADLKEGFEAMTSGFSDLSAHFKAMPIPMEVFKGGEAAITAWVTEKVAADSEFLANFGAEMAEWEKKMEELGSELEEMDDSVFEKYGIEVEQPSP